MATGTRHGQNTMEDHLKLLSRDLDASLVSESVSVSVRYIFGNTFKGRTVTVACLGAEFEMFSNYKQIYARAIPFRGKRRQRSTSKELYKPTASLIIKRGLTINRARRLKKTTRHMVSDDYINLGSRTHLKPCCIHLNHAALQYMLYQSLHASYHSAHLGHFHFPIKHHRISNSETFTILCFVYNTIGITEEDRRRTTQLISQVKEGKEV